MADTAPKVVSGGNVDRIQDGMNAAFRRAAGNLFTGAQVLVDLSLTTTYQNFNTKLGRKWAGYLLIKTDSAVHLLADPAVNDARISLKVDAGTAVVSVLVF